MLYLQRHFDSTSFWHLESQTNNDAKLMRRKLLLLMTTMLAAVLQAQQPRQVYVTLDVSGSMNGNKYVLANYTTQMIVTLCDEADDVHMIVYGQEKRLSGQKDPLAVIQKDIRSLKFGRPQSVGSQFDDIIGFNRVYQPSAGRQDWLFIIGDGYWGTMSKSRSDERQTFQNIVKGGSLNVCYLQTCEELSEHSDFTKFVEDLGVVDIRKSSVEPKTIREGCDHFAKKILGFSATSLDIKKKDRNKVSVVAELPLTELLLVYQDEVVPERLPLVTAAACDGRQIDVRLKGTPTTQPVKSHPREQNLSGRVWRMKAQGGAIPAGKAIEITFDKDIDTDKVSVYPLVKEVAFGSFGLAPSGGQLMQVDDKTFAICEGENAAMVRVELSAAARQQLPESLLKKTNVVVKANNKEYKATYKDGGFECKIDLEGATTQYYAECDCPGYFSRVTPIMTIVKDPKACQPVEPPVVERPAVDFGTMSFSQLKNDQIRGVIQDSDTQEVLDPEKFDISVELDDDFLYDEPRLSIEGNTLVIDVHPRGDWCECLFPTDLNLRVLSTPKEGAFSSEDKNYVQTVTPVHLRIEKDRPWLSRCLWVVVALVLLVLLLFYLRALMKKRRFKKNAMLTPRYLSYYGDMIEDQGGSRLRREGFGAWFQRWLLPGDERTTLSFDKPAINGLTLIASESKEVVRIPKACCDWTTMRINGYDPETDIGKEKTVKLGNMNTVEVCYPDGRREGEAVFTSGKENDGTGYRIFLGLLMAADVLAIVALLWLMLRSLL